MLADVWACIASGPSLTADDCELIRATGLTTVAVNNSWRIAPFCSHIYAGDPGWWDAYGADINIRAERWTCFEETAQRHGISHHPIRGAYNSGLRAVQFAAWRGAKTIILVGYDASLSKGLHWHGPHSATGNPSQDRVDKWHRQFAIYSRQAAAEGITILNCSRHTELNCFAREPLESVLARLA